MAERPSRAGRRSPEERAARAERRTRRRFARRQWARRWGALRWVVASVLLVGAVVGTLWLVYFSDVLAVKGVSITGNDRLSQTELRRTAAVPEGEPLARLDLGRVRARVEALADVESADVTRQWPDRVRIDVVERTPVAVVELGGRLRALDRDGVVFSEYPTAPAALPRVRSAATADRDALREAALVVSAMPADLAAKVEVVVVETIDQISLELRDGRSVLWGSAEESELKARVLRAALGQKGRVFDVSVPTKLAVG